MNSLRCNSGSPEGNPRPRPRSILSAQPLTHRWEKEFPAVGLRNVGNATFASSVLQCLLHVPTFDRYLTCQHSRECKRQVDECILCSMVRLSEDCFRGSGRPVDPSEVMSRLGWIGGSQRDDQDFLLCLVERMQDSLAPLERTRPDRYSELTTSVGRIFGSILKERIHCNGCNRVSSSYEPIYALGLNSTGKDSLEEALEEFSRSEETEAPRNCDSCGCKRTVAKSYSIDGLPQCLIVRLEEHGRWQKPSRRVEFPEILNLESHAGGEADRSVESRYLICGAVARRGSVDSDRYYAHALNPSSGGRPCWYTLVDEKVTSTNWEEVSKCEACLLFYIRLDCQPSNTDRTGRPSPTPGVHETTLRRGRESHAPQTTPTKRFSPPTPSAPVAKRLKKSVFTEMRLSKSASKPTEHRQTESVASDLGAVGELAISLTKSACSFLVGSVNRTIFK